MPRDRSTRSPHSDLLETSRFFMRKGAAWETLRRLDASVRDEYRRLWRTAESPPATD